MLRVGLSLATRHEDFFYPTGQCRVEDQLQSEHGAFSPEVHMEYSWLDIPGTNVVNTTSLFHYMSGLTQF
jgi:hypothetical protein